MSGTTNQAVVWNDDLIFFSRIEGRSRAGGCKAVQAKDRQKAIELAGDPRTLLVLVDIHLAGADLGALLASFAGKADRPRVIGFGSHVEATALKAAREAGCDLVLPRSKFVEDLVEKWDQWASRVGQS